jgi:hypothetical protein
MKKHTGALVVLGAVAAVAAVAWWSKGSAKPKSTIKGATLPDQKAES